MGKIIGVCNQKGGTGKTTTVVNLAAFVALAGHKTLLIDLDPQGNASSGVGIDRDKIDNSAYDFLSQKALPKEIVYHTDIRNLYIIPATTDLAGAEIELARIEEREFFLREVIKPVRQEFEYVFIDAPPSLGVLTLNVLVASDSVVVPIQCEYYALEGLSRLFETLNLVRESLNPQLEIEGIVLTMADFRTRLTFQVIEEVRDYFKKKVYHTIIPRNIKISESPSFGKPIYFYEPSSPGAKAYFSLTREFLNKKIEGVYDDEEESIRQRVRSIDSPKRGIADAERIQLY